MEIPREKAEKLSKYLINADPFLWGVLQAKNKKGRLKELQDMGYLRSYSTGSNPLYPKINRDLLVELGIQGILEKIVIPRIQTGFNLEILRHFRDCWQQGQTPDLDYLTKNRLYRKHSFFTLSTEEVHDTFVVNPPVVGYRDSGFVFVQIDTQHNFIERWTVFAGLWFEEVEPLLR
jgi:hypothetical protein